MRQGNYKRVLTKTQARTAAELHSLGWSLERIGRLYGVSKQGIWSLLSRRGVDTGGHPVSGNGGRFTFGVHRKRRRPDGSVKAERDEAGVIVTLIHLETQERFSMHVPGKRLEALRHVADTIDHTGEPWRVICYSTPDTILGDLGALRDGKPDDLGPPVPPEARALGKIGRMDLLHESIRRSI